MINEKVAWYLDEDILLKGIVNENIFYPDTDKCGFRIQEFDTDMIDKEIFFDLKKALSVCGNIPIITDEAKRTND